jgi:hypothetical protein
MKSFRTVLLMFTAVLMLSAVAASSALATEWYENGTALKESKPVTSAGTITLEDVHSVGGAVELKCSFGSGGTVGAAGKGSITTMSVTKCTFGKYGICEKKEGLEAKVTSLDLPWATRLYQQPTGMVNIWSNGGKGDPTFRWECTGVLKKAFTDECTPEGVEGDLIQPFVVNDEKGDVLEDFEALQMMRCTSGGAGSGSVFLRTTVKLTSGAELSVK